MPYHPGAADAHIQRRPAIVIVTTVTTNHLFHAKFIYRMDRQTVDSDNATHGAIRQSDSGRFDNLHHILIC